MSGFLSASFTFITGNQFPCGYQLLHHSTPVPRGGVFLRVNATWHTMCFVMCLVGFFLTQAVSIHCCSTLCSLIKTIHIAKQVVQNPTCGQCTSGICCGTNNEYFINIWAEKILLMIIIYWACFFASFMLISTTNDMYHKMYTVSFNCSSQKA